MDSKHTLLVAGGGTVGAVLPRLEGDTHGAADSRQLGER